MMDLKKISPVLAVVVVGVALTGCTGQEPGQPGAATASTSVPPATSAAAPVTGTSAPPAPTATEAPTPVSTRCTAAVLRGTVGEVGAAAGNRYAKLIVTNTGATECTLYGYGGFQLVGANGAPLPTQTERDEPPAPSLVRLTPGATAAKTLHWGVVASGEEPAEGPCQPEPRSARVIPPDETEPFTVDWTFGPVCSGGRISDSAYYPA